MVSVISRAVVETEITHSRKLGNDDGKRGQEIDGEVGQVIMCVMSADEEQNDGNAEQELFGRRVLVAAVDLLPHVQVVVGSSIELKGHTSYPVEHEKRAKHV